MGIVNVSAAASIESNAGSCTATTITVQTTNTSILSANPNRKRALILNAPTNNFTIYLQFGETATTTTGLPLSPGQGWLEESLTIYQGQFSAIADEGTAIALVYEWS